MDILVNTQTVWKDGYDTGRKSAGEEIEKLVIRNEALVALLIQHRCNVDGRMTVGECIAAKQCGCSCGLLILKPSNDDGRSR